MGLFDIFKKKKQKEEIKPLKETKKYDKIEKIMSEKNLSFFDAVWEYFLSVGALEKFKEAYISQLESLEIDEELEEADLTLTSKQKEIVKSELDKKIDNIRNGKYNEVFESVFKDEVKFEVEMSNNNAVGGLSPDEYLDLLFNSFSGALFFFSFSVSIKNKIPVVKLDIDDGEIDWQPFD